MPDTQLGHLLISGDGETASLTQNGLPATALLVVTLAKFFSPQERRDSHPTVKMSGKNVAQVTYDCQGVKEAVQLTVHWDQKSHPELDFYTFHWKKPTFLNALQDSLKLGGEDVQWYGGSNLMDLEWPIHKNTHKMSEFVLNDIYQFTKTSGQERYWLSSKKVALTVPWNVPLWTAIQNGELDLQSRLTESQFLLRNDHLEYTLTVPKDEKMSMKNFHQLCFKQFLKAPTAYPDTAIMEKPIWSTWASFWTEVNQTQVEEYAEQVKQNGFPISQLELDDKWTTAYGDYKIDTIKFPDFKGMIQRLKDNFGVPRMTAWVHPFVNSDSDNGRDMELRNKIFIKDKNGEVPLSWWWDCPPKPQDPSKPVGPDNPDKQEPCAYVIDLTNPAAREWWHGELKRMQQEGIYTFKFDAGETNWFPKNYALYAGSNPNDFGQQYAHFSAQFGPAVENRYGSGSQQANIFMRTMDRNSYWDKEGGLFTLIPWALQSSLHGYYWNLPDMIGGNGLNHTPENIKGDPPEPELYIRWTQANAFLLAMQFSYPPWHQKYGPNVVKAVKEVLEIRTKWMPYIIKCVKKAVKEQEPVIRPMWWESDAKEALACRDQYMVGNDLVVAPVVQKKAVKRNIFLPPGTWKDGNNETMEYEGGKMLTDYPAPLDVVPFFYRMGTSPSASAALPAAMATATSLLAFIASMLVTFLLNSH